MIGNSWHSHPKIWNLGHRALADLLVGQVIVQEKVDGSQFSFGVYDGVLKVRSKGQEMNPDAPEKMFQAAVDTVKKVQALLVDGYMYRGEYLQKPKHNTLAYDRTPTGNIILFDVCTSEEAYLPCGSVAVEAARLGLEMVPTLYEGNGAGLDLATINKLMDTTSILGGQKIEGIVVKNYSRFGEDKKVLMGKYVSEAFKEVHKGDWRERNPSSGDVVDLLSGQYLSPARWAKAVQHLKEAGQLEGSPKDIGALMKEVPQDIFRECEAEIKEALFKAAWPKIARRSVHGLPEWYKQQLLARQFDDGEAA